jgi:demethylspheroidene O-methyltransferase
MAGTSGAERVTDAYFNFYFLAMGSGLPRSTERLGVLLKHAGFDQVQTHNTGLPLVCSVLTARARH